MSSKEKIQEEIEVLEQRANEHQTVLFNDDINSFDYVIDSLVDVCERTIEQAE